MKRILSIIIVLSIGANLTYAQRDKPRNLSSFDYKRLHWGFTVGLNSMDYSIIRNPDAAGYLYPDVRGFQPAGFQVNIVSDLRLSDFWNLRFLPGINLGSRQFVYFDPYSDNLSDPYPETDYLEEVHTMTIGSSFLDFPLLLKYRSERVNNYRPYVIGGLSYRHDMSARKDYNSEDQEDDRILVKKGNLYIELGFGVDSYLKYFKFSTEIKLAVGLRNMMVNDFPFSGQEYYANSISDLRSFLVMLNFHFE
ncbi:MAG: PorT family protein [Bacteroidales bacterium]|nr:PorT family protein [Bacteroidales bacterium]